MLDTSTSSPVPHSDDTATQKTIIPTRLPEPTEPELLNDYFENGYDLIKLHKFDTVDKEGRQRGKSPYDQYWRKLQYTASDIEGWIRKGNNVGVRLTATDLVVDYDPRSAEPGDDPLKRFCKDVGINMDSCPMVYTGSGGIHLYLKKPADFPTVETLPAYKGLEFKTLGRQVVAAGSVHPNGSCYVWMIFSTPLAEVQDAPHRMLQLIQRSATTGNVSGDGEVTPEQLEMMLSGLNAEDYAEHDTWLKLAMACHHATGGEGAEEFADWSTSDPRYSDHREQILHRWYSFRTDGNNLVTSRTLYKALHDKGMQHLIPVATSTAQFEENGLTEETEQSEGVQTSAINAEQFSWSKEQQRVLNEWVWLVGPSTFMNRTTQEKLDRTQWESKFAQLVDKGMIVNHVWKGKFPVPKFDTLVYLPDAGEFPDGSAGGRYNRWRPSGVEARPGNIAPFLEHMEYLFPDEQERKYALDFLSLLIRRPAEKINYALLIHGTQGTGKSWVGRMMVKIIGEQNIVEPFNEEIIGKFTSWQEGAELAIVHELMMLGRLDAANRLKSVITEPQLRIEEKYCKVYSIPNYLNLLCFTNHRDAMLVEDGDRRWLIISSPAKPREAAYYDALFKYIDSDEGPAAVKHFLMSREVKLKAKGTAPMTAAKEFMRDMSVNDAEDYLMGLYEEKAYPFNHELVRLEDIMGKLTEAVQNRELSCKSIKNASMKFMRDKLDAVQHKRNTKSDGEPKYRLWSTGNHSHWAKMSPSERYEAYKGRSGKKGVQASQPKAAK